MFFRWVEPASKSNAKKVANSLNGEQIGNLQFNFLCAFCFVELNENF